MLEAAERTQRNPDDRIPVYVPLPELAKALVKTGSDTTKALTLVLDLREATLKENPLYREYVIRSITNGTAMVYLDSLDEVDGDDRPAILKWINSMAQTVVDNATPDKGAIIVTTRFTDYRGGDLKTEWFAEWVLKEMDPATQKTLARALVPALKTALATSDDFSISEDERAEIQNRVFDETIFLPAIRSAPWSSNPMLFSMAAYVYVRYGELPHARVKLYSRLMEGMIVRRSRNTTLEEVLRKKIILAELAYYLYRRETPARESGDTRSPSGGRVFAGDVITRLLTRMNRDDHNAAKEMMEDIKASGLLEPLSEGRYMFKHQSFHEYLIGVWLADRLANYNPDIHDAMFTELRDIRSQERWSEPLRFMVGELFLTHDSEDQEVGRHWIADIASKYQQSNQPIVLLQLLIGSLVEIPELENVEYMLAQKGQTLDLHTTARLWVEALTPTPLPEGEGLFPSPRKERGPGGEVPATEENHRKDREETLLRLASLLARFPTAALVDVMDQLKELTQQDGAPEQQALAARALGTLRLPETTQALIDLLERQTASEQARSAAARGLTQAGAAGRQALDSGLRGLDLTKKRIIARSLGAIDEEGLELLSFALRDQTDSMTRRNAIRSIQEMGQRAPQSYLEQALRDQAAENRSEAIEAVARVAVNYQASNLLAMTRILPTNVEQNAAVARIILSLITAGQPAKGIEVAMGLAASVPVSIEVLTAQARAQKEAGAARQEIGATLQAMRQRGANDQAAALEQEIFPASDALPERLRTFGYRVITGTQSDGKRVNAFVAPLCAIEAGPFLMGSDKKHDPQAYDEELPQHTVTTGAYAIAKYPLTVAEYQVFVEATGREEPRNWSRQLSHPDHPVVYVSWQDVLAYLQWLAQVTNEPWRMPTEAEWEKAARGTDGRIYPWGNEWDPVKANTGDGGSSGTTPVGSYPQGASPYGCLDMSGNVWECTSSLFVPYPYVNDVNHENNNNSTNSRVMRGGSWFNGPGNARAANRYDFRIDLFDYSRGGRLVRDVLAAGSMQRF